MKQGELAFEKSHARILTRWNIVGRSSHRCRFSTVWLLVVALCAFAGCHVGPEHYPPDAPLSPQWKHPEEAAELLYSDLSGPWWSQFEDPVLDRLIYQAVAANPGLQEAMLRVVEARSRYGVVSGERLPTLDLNNSYAYKKVSGNSSPYSLNSQDSFNFFSAGFDSSWEVDLWGKLSRSMEAADAEIGVADSDYNSVLLTLLGDVAATYVDLRTYQQRIVVAQQNLKVHERSLELAEARQRAGLAKPLDAAQAKSSLYSTRARLPQLEIGLQTTENRLCVLLGEPPRRLKETLGPRDQWGTTPLIPTAPRELTYGTPADLLRRRPDIRSVELQVATESAKIGVAVADLYPQLSLTGTISVDATDVPDLFTGQSIAHKLGPSLTWNILHIGRVRSRIAAQEARFEQTIWRYQTTVLAAVQEVEDALVSCQQERLRLKELITAVAVSKESIRLAQLYYEQGVKGFQNFQPVLDSQRSLLALQDQLVNSRAKLALNRIALYKALGGGWESVEPSAMYPDCLPNTLEGDYELIEHPDGQPELVPSRLEDALLPPAVDVITRLPTVGGNRMRFR